ncbi:MAG: hypothetical protein ACOYCD_04585 [Kiritimatiellia bacterium]
MHTMHKGIGLNRQEGAKVSEEDLPRTHAALTGICRSGGLVDTLIREFIRVSWMSANPCPHSGQRGIPVGSASISGKICDYLRNLRFLFLAPWRFNPISVHPVHTWFFPVRKLANCCSFRCI